MKRASKEATTGLEPVNAGFANLCLSLLARSPFIYIWNHTRRTDFYKGFFRKKYNFLKNDMVSIYKKNCEAAFCFHKNDKTSSFGANIATCPLSLSVRVYTF